MERFLLIPLFALLLSSSASAQGRNTVQSVEPTMILTGVVYDLNGSVINGSVIVDGTKVIAYNSDGRKYESATTNEGVYKIELPLGIYKIGVEAPLFCPAHVDSFIVVNSTHGRMSLDFVLESAASHAPSCKQEKIIEKRPKRKTKKKATPIIMAIKRKHNVKTNG